MKPGSSVMSDWFGDPFIKAFLDVRVHVTDLQYLPSVNARRDAYEHVIPSLTDVIFGLDELENQQRVNDILRFLQRQRGKISAPTADIDTSEHAARIAKKTYPEAVKVLGVNQELDFYLLNRLKHLARRNHLINGTYSTGVQEKIDGAFYLLHDFLSFYNTLGENTSGPLFYALRSEPKSTQVAQAWNYQIALAELLLSIHYDAWDILSALALADALVGLHRRTEHKVYDTTLLARLMSELAVRTHLTGRKTEAERILEWAKTFVEYSARTDVPTALGKAEKVISGGAKGTRIVLNHPTQVKNAYTSGAITETRFQKEMSDFEQLQAQDRALEQTLLENLTIQPFLQHLPSDPPAPLSPPDDSVTITKSTHTILEIRGSETSLLDAEQLHDYYRAFGPHTTLNLFRLNAPFRLVSLLRSLILFPDFVSLEIVEAERNVLETYLRTQAFPTVHPVTTFLDDIAMQPAAETQERLQLLKELELKSVRVIEPRVFSNEARKLRRSIKEADAIMKRLGMNVEDACEDDIIHFRVWNDENFFAIAPLPLDVLQKALRKGWIVRPYTDQELAERRASGYDKIWSRDLKLIRSLKEEKHALFSAQRNLKDSPATLVPLLEDFCKKLFEMGEQITYVGELQLGYWVNDLTITLVRAKQFDQAIAWLERYFALPDPYHERLTDTEKKTMINRLHQCKTRVASI